MKESISINYTAFIYYNTVFKYLHVLYILVLDDSKASVISLKSKYNSTYTIGSWTLTANNALYVKSRANILVIIIFIFLKQLEICHLKYTFLLR